MTDKTGHLPPRTDGLPLAVFRLLGSLRFALAVVLLIAAACVAGTLIPQGYQVARFLEQHPDAQRRMAVLDALGLTHVFFSWWFVLLLCLFATSLTACTFRRFQALRGTAGAKRIRVLGSLLTHISLLLVLVGGVLRAMWGEKGYIEFREGETVVQFAGAQGPAMLPFAVHLVDFELQLYGEPDRQARQAADRLIVAWPEKGMTNAFPAVVQAKYEMTAPAGPQAADTCLVTIRRQVPDFCIDNATREVISRSQVPNNPAILVAVTHAGKSREQWVFARFPDFASHAGSGEDGSDTLRLRYETAAAPHPDARSGAVKDFKSTLQIIDAGKVVCEKTIEVNAPLSYGGYTFYQSGYDPNDLTSTTLQVVRDPGVAVVYVGFLLMMAGLTLVFWVAPMIESGKRKDGVLS
jgi:cytochrome c biogenesis protein ResB